MNLNNYLIFIYTGKAATSPYYEKELPKITAHCIHEAESGPLIQTHFYFFCSTREWNPRHPACKTNVYYMKVA